MLDKLQADARDIALAALAAFVGALAVTASTGHGSIPLSAVVAAGWSALRFAIGKLALKLQAIKAP